LVPCLHDKWSEEKEFSFLYISSPLGVNFGPCGRTVTYRDDCSLFLPGRRGQ
jgi:hypothetical protein